MIFVDDILLSIVICIRRHKCVILVCVETLLNKADTITLLFQIQV